MFIGKKIKKKLFLFFDDIIRKRKKNICFLPIKLILFFLSYIWFFIFILKEFIYKVSLKKTHIVSPYVVSIGNISVGGTGKTPLAILLAKTLLNKEIQTAILSRGYRSYSEKRNVLVHFSEGLIGSYQHIGDEPALMAKSLPESLIVVGRDRVKSAKIAEQQKAKVIILDDGLQYKKLYKNYQIITLSGLEILDNNFFLPLGTLREPLASLKKADLIVVGIDPENNLWDQIKKKIRSYSLAPIVGVIPKMLEFQDLKGKKVDIEKNTKLAAFCAIASPQRFFSSLKAMGYLLVADLYHLDHFAFSQSELLSFAIKAKANGAKYLICTEKDAVKLNEDFNLPLPIVLIKMKLEVIIGFKHWKKMIAIIIQNSNTKCDL
jgi:tetraacyldisaccharide 4'-kinase